MGERKVTKLQEFMANSPEVLTTRFTVKSPSLLATGGADHRVGVWRTSTHSCLASLSGPTKPVTAVAFSPSPNSSEASENVVGGDASGVLRVWDLSRQQETRLYDTSCHKARVTRLDYHPFGDFFCSTSLDGNVKVWDLRKKTCLQTYKYQEGKEAGRPEVNFVKFSPDGRMVASGNADGTVILWDLTKGKRLHKITHHKDTVTSIDFHPQDFILAVGCADGVVSYWNIDTWQKVSTTPACGVKGGVQHVSFTGDGSALVAAHASGLDVWGWGSVTHHDRIAHGWGPVSALHCCPHRDEVHAATFTNSFVSIYSAKLASLAPFRGRGDGDAPQARSGAAASTPGGSGGGRKPAPAAGGGPDHGLPPATPPASAAAQQQQQQPPSTAPRPSSALGRRASSGRQPQQLPTTPTAPSDAAGGGGARLGSGHVVATDAYTRDPPAATSSSAAAAAAAADRGAAEPRSTGTEALFGRRGTTPPSTHHEKTYHDSTTLGDHPNQQPRSERASAAATTDPRTGSPTITRRRTEPNLRTTSGLLGTASSSSAQATPVKVPRTEKEAAALALEDGVPFQRILSMRLMHMKVVKSLFQGDGREAVRHLAEAARDDPGLLADVCSAVATQKMKKTLSLEVSWYDMMSSNHPPPVASIKEQSEQNTNIQKNNVYISTIPRLNALPSPPPLPRCSALVPLIVDLLRDRFESYIQVAVAALRAILGMFSSTMGRMVREVCSCVSFAFLGASLGILRMFLGYFFSTLFFLSFHLWFLFLSCAKPKNDNCTTPQSLGARWATTTTGDAQSTTPCTPLLWSRRPFCRTSPGTADWQAKKQPSCWLRSETYELAPPPLSISPFLTHPSFAEAW